MGLSMKGIYFQYRNIRDFIVLFFGFINMIVQFDNNRTITIWVAKITCINSFEFDNFSIIIVAFWNCFIPKGIINEELVFIFIRKTTSEYINGRPQLHNNDDHFHHHDRHHYLLESSLPYVHVTKILFQIFHSFLRIHSMWKNRCIEFNHCMFGGFFLLISVFFSSKFSIFFGPSLQSTLTF